MSATIATPVATAANTKFNPEVDAAKTALDVAVAMRNDPTLYSAVMTALGQLMTGNAKALVASKTFWMALITPLVGFLVSYYGLNLDTGTIGAITTVLTMAAMIGARLITKQPIGGVLSAGPAT